jgi:hypothetical protein
MFRFTAWSGVLPPITIRDHRVDRLLKGRPMAANEYAMLMIKSIGEVDRVEEWTPENSASWGSGTASTGTVTRARGS